MPAFLRRYKKTFLITASLFLVLLSGMGIGYFSSHVWSENGKFETFCREIFKKEVSENMLTLHYSLAHPEKEGITRLGNQKVKYPDNYAPEVLETFLTKHPDNDYFVKFNCPEFTSLCPITGQPDFATITISYVPGEKMVESKSLKLYLFSFRNHGAFHEDCVNIIMKDLIKLMNPKYIEVTGIFTPRGGISIYPYANYGRPGTKFEQMAEHRLMNRE